VEEGDYGRGEKPWYPHLTPDRGVVEKGELSKERIPKKNAKYKKKEKLYTWGKILALRSSLAQGSLGTPFHGPRGRKTLWHLWNHPDREEH